MIAKIKIPEQKVFDGQFEMLRSVIPSVKLKEPSDYWAYSVPEGKTKEEHQQEQYDKEHTGDYRIIKNEYSAGYVADVIMLMNKCAWLRFEVEEAILSYQTQTPEMLIHKFYEMSQKLNETVDLYNKKCNVHIGGNTLIQYNSVKVLEDSCTDALQRELDGGWRIIACCVQPDGRRPDYVLGRVEIE